MSEITLPSRKNHRTPRLLMGDAYTVGSNKFESERAKEKSVYYIAFRRPPYAFNQDLYEREDERYIFYGLQKVLDYLFYEPITHKEIDIAKEFLKDKKITTTGLAPYEFPEEIWRKIVDEYNGRPPILIKALKEGSVFYAHEPIIVIESQVEGMGILAAWFESKLLHVWASCLRVTQNEHWLKYCKSMVKEVHKTKDEQYIDFLARTMIHDFGDRAGMNWLESEILGEAHLLTFSGSDTFAGGYQAWENSNRTAGIIITVNALAHRNVQSYKFEKDCYQTFYNVSNDNEILSNVADCYDFKLAVLRSLLPLALNSQNTGNGKIIVVRPDSGPALEQILWLCELAVQNGLYEEKLIDGKYWKFATTLKFIEGDGMTWSEMKRINCALLARNFPPFAWGLYGVGGGLRNGLKRDDPSAKYALCAIGNDLESVVKISEVSGKMTFPGPFKLRRDEKSLRNATTIAFYDEEGENVLIEFFNGLRKQKPFGIGQDDNFLDIKKTIQLQMECMPLRLVKSHPASENIFKTQRKLQFFYTNQQTIKE